jgi:ATP-dependent protease ClpP protease subunit
VGARCDVRAQADGGGDLYLYDSIGGPFSTVTAERVVAQLQAVRGARVRVHLNSPGGDVFDGLAIYNTLRQHPGGVDVYVEGLAASIASVIALAGQSLVMSAASMLMVHEPHAVVIGDAHDMRHMAALLDKTTGVLVDVYGRRVADREQVRRWLHAETWLTAREAFDHGLADAIDDTPLPADALAARAGFDLSAYRRPPVLAVAAPPLPVPAPARRREHAQLLADSFARVIAATRAA